MEKRLTLRIGASTHEDLLWLASDMHSGNLTHTVTELIHAESRRRRGDEYRKQFAPIESFSGPLVDPQAPPVEFSYPSRRDIKGATPQEPVLEPQEHISSVSTPEPEVVAIEPAHDPENFAEEVEKAAALVGKQPRAPKKKPVIDKVDVHEHPSPRSPGEHESVVKSVIHETDHLMPDSAFEAVEKATEQKKEPQGDTYAEMRRVAMEKERKRKEALSRIPQGKQA